MTRQIIKISRIDGLVNNLLIKMTIKTDKIPPRENENKSAMPNIET
jgi:hypothetical protein